jgi:hypothetical protein
MRLFNGLLLLLVTTVSLAADVIPTDKEVLEFRQSKIGVVTFEHKKHSMLDGVKCNTCHHTTQGNGKQEDCHNCHKASQEGEAPKSIQAFHTRCRGCHQYTVDSGSKAGPVKKCTLCHIRTSPGPSHTGQQ